MAEFNGILKSSPSGVRPEYLLLEMDSVVSIAENVFIGEWYLYLY